MTAEIRDFRAKDASAVAALYAAAVRGIGPRHYAPRQVEAWAARAAPPDWYVAKQERLLAGLVAVDGEGRAIAYGDLEPDGHLDFLYCAPEHAGTGVTAALYAELEACARAGGVSRIYVEASEAAKRFFEKQGYTLVRRRDFDIDGVPIHNFAMEKAL